MGDGPFVCYREFMPPTSVVGSEYFQCFNKYTKQYDWYLATISPTVLHVYSVKFHNVSPTAVFTGGDNSCAKLLLAKYEKIFGKAKEIKAYHRGNEQHDLLILGVDECKIIAMEYVPHENIFNESIICNIEETAFGVGADIRPISSGKNVYLGSGSDPIIKVNEKSQMMCVSVYGEELLFASFDSNVALSWQADNIVHHQMLFNLKNDLKLQGPILDICFLEGYSQPTIAILQEENFLPIGHAKAVRNTCSLTAVAVDLNLKSISILWKRSGLPHDCLSLIGLPVRGLSHCVGIISQNAFLVIGERSAYALALNGFATISVDTNAIELSPWHSAKVGVELDASFWTILAVDDENNNISLVGFLRNASALYLQLYIPENTQLSNLLMEATLLNTSVRPSCCASTSLALSTSICENLLFVGSRNGQSMMYRSSERLQFIEASSNGNIDPGIFVDHCFIDIKNLRKRKLNWGIDNECDDLDWEGIVEKKLREEEAELYGSAYVKSLYKTNISWKKRFELHEVDKIEVMGPILSGLTTKHDELFSQVSDVTWDRSVSSSNLHGNIKPMQSVSSYIVEKESKEALVITSGLDQYSSINRVFSGIGLGKVGGRNFPGATRMFTVTVGTFCLLLVSYESKTKVLQCKENLLNSQSLSAHHLPDLRFNELTAEDSGFIVTSSTLGAAVIQKNFQSSSLNEDEDTFSIVVQVVPIGVRLIKINSGFGSDNEAIQDMLLSDSIDIGGLGGKIGETICTADFLSTGYVVILTNLQNMYVIRYVEDELTLEIVFYQESRRSISNNKKARLKLTNVVDNNPFSFIKNDIVSASFFNGHIAFATESILKNAEQVKSDNTLSELEKEEVLLYGSVLNDTSLEEKEKAVNCKKECMDEISSEGMCSGKSARFILVISDASSKLYFVDAESGLCLWETDRVDPQSITLSLTTGSTKVDERKEELMHRFIVETRFERLAFDVGTTTLRYKLVLLILFHTGELVVFDALEVQDPGTGNSITTGFYKTSSRTIQNKKFTVNTTMAAKDSLSGGGNPIGIQHVAHTLSASDNKRKEIARGASNVDLDDDSYLLSEDYIQRGSLLTVMTSLASYFTSDIILIGCSDPLIFALPQGYGAFYPLDFPETPYVNAGNFIIKPFHSNTFSFLASMWFEFEDLDSLKNPQHMKNRAQKQSTLSLYRFLPRQVLSPYGGVSHQPIAVSQTVLKCQEILKLTDDSTEQALLDKKTFLILCSSDKVVPFSPSVVSGSDSIAENEIVVRNERYFPDVESFSQPDVSFAPAPNLIQKEYKVCLIQNGKVVDAFPVKENEQILDMTVAYFNVERPSSGSNLKGPPAERRIFVVVSTVYADQRGEDTQGKGRILLLSLDYAMFGGDEHDEHKLSVEDPDQVVEENESSHSIKGGEMEKTEEYPMELVNGDGEIGKNSRFESGKKQVQFNEVPNTRPSGEVKSQTVKSGNLSGSKTSSSESAQRQFLGAIQPKLRFLSETAGPASVVMQIPTGGMKEGSGNTQANPWTNFIITTIGSTLYIHKFNSTTFELNQLAFFFAQVSTTR